MGADELAIRKLMQSGDLEEFVSVPDDAISEEDRNAVVCADPITQVTGSKVDLVKLAYYYVQGFDAASMAKIFDVTPEYINALKRSAKFKNIIQVLNNEIVSTARTFLTASGLKAVTTLIKCMNSNDDRIKLGAAREVLDRIGLKSPDQLEIIQKGDRLREMDETELLEVVKLGMKEIMPEVK